MPEGPEIRLVADRLERALAGQVARRVRFGQARMAGREEELEGLRVESVRPRGKALLTRFEGGRVLYTHNQLYGKWMTCLPERPPATTRSLRVAIETDRKWALLYSASDIELLYEEDLEEHPFLAKLGPDLLDERTTPAVVRRRLGDPRFRGRAFGGLLLDQGFVAGIGNYLRSEILFFAGLTPEQRPKDLDDDERAHLARTMKAVIRRSYRTKGVTELASYAKAARAAGEPRRHWRHAVFARGGQDCRRCGTRIEKERVATRQYYRCHTCQAR